MSLRNQLIRLAHEDKSLRPQLLQVLAGSGLTQFLSRDFEDVFGASEITAKVLQWGEGEIDATTSVDRWDHGSDSHYTEDGGGYVQYRFPSKILCTLTTLVPNMPPNSSVRDVQNIVTALLSHAGVRMIQDNLLGGSDPEKFLTDALDVQEASVKNPSWKVKRGSVKDVRVRFERNTAIITSQLLLDIDVDLDDADVEIFSADRYASLRARVIRLAHEHPEFRAELLPLVK